MTLIAGFQYSDVPLLLGDFMISRGARGYTLKKVHLVSPNLVVGWTGHLFMAKPILRDLHNKFNGVRVSREGLEQFLTNYPVDNSSSMLVHLVGWIVDDAPRCFLWNSSYPQELFYEPYHVDGLGATVFENMLRSRGKVGIQGTRTSNVDQAVYFALTQSCILMSDEVLARNNQQMGFGHGYEVLYYDGQQFKFIDDILYTTWDFYYDVNSKGGDFRFYPAVYKYRSFDYYSVVQIYNFETTVTDFNAITPAFDDMPNLFDNIPGIDITKGTSFPIASNFYCLFFRFQASDNLSSTGSLVFPAGQPNLPFYIDKANGKEHLNFKFDFLP